MNGILFTDAEILQQEADAQKHIRARSGVLIKAGVTFGLLVPLLVGVAGCEYGWLHEIFSYLKQALPGEQTQWSVNLLAAVGVLAVLAFHLRASENPQALPVRFIKRFVDGAIPLYAVGMGLVFAAILWNDGADTFGQSAGSTLFAEPGAPTGGSFDELVSRFGMVFVLGCGGLAVINLFIGHSLISRIGGNIEDIRARCLAAKEAKREIETIRTAQNEYRVLCQKRDALLEVDDRAAEVALSHHIVACIHEQIIPYERWLAERQFRGPTDDNRLRGEEDLQFDVKEMQKRVAALKAISPKTVIAAIRAEIK